jgi:hypothetical protein
VPKVESFVAARCSAFSREYLCEIGSRGISKKHNRRSSLPRSAVSCLFFLFSDRSLAIYV